MRTIIAVMIVFLTAIPCLAEKSFDDIIYSMESVELPNDQEAFFQDDLHVTQLYLNINDIDAISPHIGQLRDLQVLHILGGTCNRDERRELTIPLELLNLPNLHTLIIRCVTDVRLPPGTEANQIQSKIERLHISGWIKNSIPFLGSLTQLREISLSLGDGLELPTGLEQLHRLRTLRIEEHAEPLALEPLCGLANLRQLELITQSRPLPDCLTRLTHLKTVSMPSCRREDLPDKTKIAFPTVLASLPNLEELNLVAESYCIEMPKASYGLKNLRTLTVMPWVHDRSYGRCPDESRDTFDAEHDCEQFDLDNVVEYPKLEKIILRDADLKGSTQIQGIHRFLSILDTAWKQGKVPSLMHVDILAREDDPTKTVTVWKRPSTKMKSGIIRQNVNVLQKNR